MEQKKEKRGQRMNPVRKREIEKTAPIKAMKVCGSISLGDQSITSKCLKAVQIFKERYTGEKLKEELRNHLYKDIERLLINRRAKHERDYAEQTRHLNREMNKVTPRALRNPRLAESTDYYSSS